MKKRILVLLALLFASANAFYSKELNVGSYKVGDIRITYDDISVSINDLKGIEIMLNFIDVDTAVKASSKIKEVIVKNNIASVKQMLFFFDKQKIEYEYYYYFYDDCACHIYAQAFVEEYLVPKYGIKSGIKDVFPDHTTEHKNWNKEKQGYDYIIATYADYTVEGKNMNKDQWGEWYDYILFTYADHTEEYKNYDKEIDCYTYALFTYADRTVEAKQVDNDYYNVDIKDNTGKIIAYDHTITPLKNGKRDIEVFSGGIVYQYFGVKESKDGETLTFKSLNKIENGKTQKLKDGSLSSKDFYMDAYLSNQHGFNK